MCGLHIFSEVIWTTFEDPALGRERGGGWGKGPTEMNSSLLIIGKIDLKCELFWLTKSILVRARQGGDGHLAVEITVNHQQLIHRGHVGNNCQGGGRGERGGKGWRGGEGGGAYCVKQQEIF
jgi:hypothetical protein